MARKQHTDFFQNNRFHLVDLSFEFPLVLLPVFGFTGCSAPEVGIDLEDVKEGTYEFPRKVNKGRASISTITLRQGLQFINSDLWDWMRKSLTGNVGRRSLLLVHFSRVAATKDLSFTKFGQQVDIALRVPGKAWYLVNCIPSRLKLASDMDALDTGISVSELDLDMEGIFQFDMGI